MTDDGWGKLTKNDLNNALAALEPGDRQRILRIAAMMEQKIGEGADHKIMFGRLSALELIAKIGMFYIEHNIKN